MKTTELSQSQKGIYYACINQENPENPENQGENYQIPFLYTLPETVDLNRLKTALESFIKAHPYILSHIVTQDGDPMMEAGEFREVPIIQGTPEEKLNNQWKDLLTQGLNLNSQRDDLFRIEIYKTPNGNYLLLDFHHIIFDGSSFNILADDLRKAYLGKAIEPEAVDGNEVAQREIEKRTEKKEKGNEEQKNNEDRTETKQTNRDGNREISGSNSWKEQQEWYLKAFGGAQDLDSKPVPTESGAITESENKPSTEAGPQSESKPSTESGTIKDADYSLGIKEETIRAICEKYGVKKSTVFMAAWGKMLANYTAEDKAVFATIHHGRNDADTARTISMMVRTLPVYMEMPSSKTISQWLKDLEAQQEMTRKLNAYSFADIHSDLGLGGDCVFAYHGKLALPSDFPIQLGNDMITCRDLRTPRPGCALDGQLFALKDEYLLRFSYDTRLYSQAMIEGMLGSFRAILMSMEKAACIAELKAADENQIQWLDGTNPATSRKEAERKVLPDIIDSFRKNAKERPESICCHFEGKNYTYARMDELTDSLAGIISDTIQSDEATLNDKALQSDDPHQSQPVVSFVCTRSEWQVIMPLAIAKAGCIYQPLDSSYPEERLAFMVSDSKAGLLLYTSEFQELADSICTANKGTGLKTLVFSSTEELKPSAPKTVREHSQDDTCLLLYTSGTTGTPKGVQLTFKNVATLSEYHRKNVELTPESRVASYASYGFDAYMLDLWSALVAGSALYIIGESIRFDLDAVYHFYLDNGITHAIMTTQVGTQMAISYPDIPCMKYMGVGGEKLVSFNPPSYHFINYYGPTETSCYITSFDFRANEKNIPIGSPTETTRIYIVNKDGQRVPMGAAGELWAAGPQVGKGYLNLPEKTAAVFVDNPFASTDSTDSTDSTSTSTSSTDSNPENDPQGDAAYAKAYRTGDIVRYREDGLLEFVGRKDGQVKIRGFRIELKEVEAVIREFPGVKEVTVQAYDLEAGGKALAAYVVADDKIDEAALGAFIMERKPPYMVPAVTMQLEAIPLNVNGKVDKKKLPVPKRNSSEAEQQQAAPLNRLEEELMALVSSMTDCGTLPVTTPLAYAGLTSISSLKFASQLYKKYGIQVSVQDLTHTETIQSIENRILEKLLETYSDDRNIYSNQEKSNSTKENSFPSEEKSRVSAEKPTAAPLSNAQTGVYFECMKAPDSTVYNIPELITFPEGTAPEAIKEALEKVIAIHPALLSVIDNSVDPPMFKLNEKKFRLTDEHRNDTKESDRISRKGNFNIIISENSAETIRKDFVRPFNLTEGPLYRAVITGNRLFFDAHHLVMDGSSLSIFLHQVCDALDGREPDAEKSTVWELALAEKEIDTKEAEAFFAQALSGVEEATAFPADLHGDETKGRQGEAVRPADHGRIEAFARKLGLTPAGVYLAALEYIAARYANNRSSCICTVSSGRSDLRTDGTVGMFVNTLALSSQIGNGSVEDYIRSVADNFSGAIAHECLPFAKIAEKYGLSPEIMFVYELGVIEDFRTAKGKLTLETLELSAPKSKCSLLVEEREGQACLVAQYNDAIYSAAMMDRMLESLLCVIDNFIQNPEGQIRHISIVSEAQRKELEGMHNTGVFDIPVKIVHKGIERWVKDTPDAVAVIAKDKSMTFAEFDLEANIIANALLEKGLQKGDAVVVLLPRRSSTLSCIFGIMKAGGAFIPCDPEYPAERIKLIAEDSGAPFVVTTPELLDNYGSRGLCIDELLAGKNGQCPEVNVQPEDLVYMIYTSGSTGKPKGVRVTHGNITTTFTFVGDNDYLKMLPCRKQCCVSTISFDAFIMEYGTTLFHGRTLVFADELEAKDPIALTALMDREDVDCMTSTSSRFLQYLELPAFVERIRKCKCLLQGGEKFSPVLLEKLKALCPDAAILNGYGPTEISISCNIADLHGTDIISVGKPHPNYFEWILDKDRNELPVGVTGELCVGGNGVTQGYNNLPELTAQKFIEYGGMRAFLTGDYARWMSDGCVEVLGRTDNQVKLRGLRIELGEVESAISKVEGVRNVCVKICNIAGRDHLCAYYSADRPIPIEEMKKSISATLTAYMVPSAYLQMETLPTTPNGKIDFRHLPEPVLARSSQDYVAPANATEKAIADVFASVLELDKVSVTDSFFDLGGTSLVVMKVVIKAQEAGFQVTYADVFSHPTVRQLAAFIGGGTVESDPDADLRDFDFKNIDKLLSQNTLGSYMSEKELRPLGNVLLTGATGFLGIHIFDKLLTDYPECRIHLILRSRKDIPAQERLLQMMFYYFEKNCSDQIGKRVFVHEGDVTASIDINEKIDTVINCAALVKHFSKGTEIEDVNVGGVRNCIDFCLRTGARLIQVSTYSVAGVSVNGTPSVKSFDERMLWIGQRIRNQYVHSKIMGERLILEAVATKGLDAKIMRVGNLSARSRDGEFQINVKANSFMGRLKVYRMLGALPYSAYEAPVEFSPIDQTAAAICLLAGVNASCTVFHPYNNHYQMLGDVLDEMGVTGKDIRLVEDGVFSDLLNKAKADSGLQEELSSMLAYETRHSDEFIQVIAPDNSFTQQVLLRLGFKWNTVSWDYVDQFLRQIDSLQFFEK